MTPSMRTESRIVAVNVVDLEPGLTVDADLITGLCETASWAEIVVINDNDLRERLAAAGWITIRASNICQATPALRAVTHGLGLY